MMPITIPAARQNPHKLSGDPTKDDESALSTSWSPNGCNIGPSLSFEGVHPHSSRDEAANAATSRAPSGMKAPPLS